ncbi:MAG: DNA replication/repair protein RecF [Anaerolineales bacterium]|nr:DNA replication/repair protein RecF [Anaerolineales bacterium]
MLIRHLSLTNFRLYARLEAALPAGPLILVGANAQGKTSLLEALYYLAAGQSHHATSDRQLINFLALRTETLPFAKIVAEASVEANLAPKRLEVRLILDPSVAGEGRLRKEVLVNGVKRRVGDLAGQVNVVLFLPHDLTIVEGSPSDRRRMLDVALGQVDPAYAFALSEYGKVLAQRNALLKQLQERGGPDGQLEFWDEKLCEHGARILAARAAALADLETLASAIHRDLTRGTDGLRLAYHPAYDPVAAPERQLGLALDVPVHRAGVPLAEVQAGLRERLQATRAEEIARGATLCGPHRDEIRFLANGVDLGTYGSRGQARTAVLALKLAEVDWMRTKTGEWPILLLDEVLAELDLSRRRELLARLGAAQQCLLTTTDLALFPPDFVQSAAVWRVEAGRIEERS